MKRHSAAAARIKALPGCHQAMACCRAPSKANALV